jgi:hypothetical protein
MAAARFPRQREVGMADVDRCLSGPDSGEGPSQRSRFLDVASENRLGD